MKKTIHKILFDDFIYKILFVSFTLNFLALDFILLSQATTLRILFAQNTIFYNSASIILSLTTAVLFGLSSTMLVYIFKKRKENAIESAPSSLFGTIFGAIASGCPVCGAWLLPILGVAGSLAVFPLQGLEIKILAIILLSFSISQSSKIILGICKPKNAKKRLLFTATVILLITAILFALPNIPSNFKIKFQRSGINAPTQKQIAFEANIEKIFDQVNPKTGFSINANFGNIGYKLVKNGVIDFEKFKAVYARSGNPLTEKQLKIFTENGLDEKITINRENSYFLLNLFWAFGLANENPILTDGEIVKYGKGKVAGFASTSGWSIAKKPLAEIYAKSKLAPLTEKQQQVLQKVAENTYRPCCGNSTAFPDCNHGMALLGMLELLAANDATETEMFNAAKYFSAFWFPSQALDVATLFSVTKNQTFAEIDSKTFVSQQYFSGRGWSQLKRWLESNLGNAGQVAPQSGGGCGVESGAPARSAPRAQRVSPQGGGGCGV